MKCIAFSSQATTGTVPITYTVEMCATSPCACAGYVDKEAFSSLCKMGCANYGCKWSCPPFAPSFLSYTQRWTYLYLVFMHVDTDQFSYIKNDYLKIKAANSILKSRADRYIRFISEQYNGSCISTGSCRLCKPCKRRQGLPCAHPDRMAYSIEALGVNVGRMVEDCFQKPLLWYRSKQLPAYTSVVCGILTNQELTLQELATIFQTQIVK